MMIAFYFLAIFLTRSGYLSSQAELPPRMFRFRCMRCYARHGRIDSESPRTWGVFLMCADRYSVPDVV